MNCWYYTDYHRGHGPINVSDAIEKSCNYFFYETGDRMGIDKLAEFAKYFGLGSKTGIELQGETSGVLADRETKQKMHPDDPNWNPGNTLNASIGQGDNEFSPLQMARYISMLANGGHKVDVSIVKTIRNADGSETSKEEMNQFVNKKLGLDDMMGGSFTITNGGVFGSLMSTPIINGTQAAILGMHSIVTRPIAIDKERMENRPMMYIALSYDHRIIDGKQAVGFLKTIKDLIENPEDLLLES